MPGIVGTISCGPCRPLVESEGLQIPIGDRLSNWIPAFSAKTRGIFSCVYTEINFGKPQRKNPDDVIHVGIQFPAESEGFEPPVPLGTTVFKTAAIDHSANSPRQK